MREAKPGEEYLSFSVGEEHGDPDIAEFYSKLTVRRQQARLKIRVLIAQQAKETHVHAYSREVLKAIHGRYTPFYFPQGIVIFHGKVIILDWGGKTTAVVITSRRLYSEFRKFFYEIYSKAKE